MSELQAYYEMFRTGCWAEADADRCPCHGNGWALSDVDTWHECPIHYNGQMHPECYDYESAPVTHDTVPTPAPDFADPAPDFADDDIPF